MLRKTSPSPARVSHLPVGYQGTIHHILCDILGLVKKSARWATNLLTMDQKQDHVWTCKEFVVVQHCSMAMLDNIITMDVGTVD
jgi:hypothetical protein